MADTSYHSIDDITIWVFYEILNKGDLSVLGDHKNPHEVWMDIYNEYFVRSGLDNTNLKQLAKVESFTKKYEFIANCLEKLRYSHYLISVDGFKENKEMYAKELRSKGYLFNDKKPFNEELERLRTQLDSLKMKIVIEEGKIEKHDKKISVSVWKEIAMLHKITGMELNPKTNTVGYLIEVRNIAKEITKNQQAA